MMSYADRLIEWVLRQPLLDQLLNWYQAQSARDQFMLRLLGAFLLGVVLVFGLWLPAQRSLFASLADYEKNTADLGWMRAHQAEAAASGSAVLAADGTPLEARATSSAREAGLQLSRFEPSTDGGVRMWFEGVAFNDLLAWLHQLQSGSRVSVAQMEVERVGDGVVNASLSLRE